MPIPSSDVDRDVVRGPRRVITVVGAFPSSLNGGDDDPVLHDALLLDGLEPSCVSQAARGEWGEQDRLINTNAALHSSMGSSSLMLLMK